MIRVLLIVDEPAWRRLLEEQLASRCELVPGGGGALSQPFDAAIVDRLALARLEGSILARKEADGPLHLPFILAVAGHELRSMAPAPAAIDECLAMPPAAEELRARLESVLKVRSLSRELAGSRDDSRARAEAEARYRQLVAMDADAVFINHEGRCVFVNEA